MKIASIYLNDSKSAADIATPAAAERGVQGTKLRTADHRSQFIYAKPGLGAVPTLFLALFVWAAIFGAGMFAWSLMNMLR